MGSDNGDANPISSHSAVAHSNTDRIDHQPAPYSYVKSRLQRSRTEAANDIKSWATDGNMKGHVLLVRNSRMLVANIIAERALETQLWNLSRERNECLRARDRDRQFFLRHLGLKGERFREIVVKIESRKKVRPGTVHLPVYQRNGLLSHVHEYPLARRTSGFGDVTTKPEALMVHPLPFMSSTNEEEMDKQTGNDDILPKEEVEPRFRKEERKSTQWIHSRRNIRSTSAIPATRGRYESCLPVRVPVRDSVTVNFLRSSDLLQGTPAPQPEHGHDLEFCSEAELEDQPMSCRVFSATPLRPLTAPESIHVARLIDEIDSLHVPSTNQKKAKARTDVLLKEIFRS